MTIILLLNSIMCDIDATVLLKIMGMKYVLPIKFAQYFPFLTIKEIYRKLIKRKILTFTLMCIQQNWNKEYKYTSSKSNTNIIF